MHALKLVEVEERGQIPSRMNIAGNSLAIVNGHSRLLVPHFVVPQLKSAVPGRLFFCRFVYPKCTRANSGRLAI